MKVRYIILIAIILLLLSGVATADVPLIPDKITISLNRDWPIANGIDQVTITAHPYNTTNVSVVFPGQPVFFSVNNSALGRVNPVSSITGSNGNAVSTFTTSTKSGVAEINVFVIGSTPTISNTTYLNIDHGDPYEILTPANYTGEQTVGETIEIKLKLVDKYGNLIDNKGPINPAHQNYEKVAFQVTSPEGGEGAYFKNLTTFQFTDQQQTLTVNDTGIVFTTLKVDTVPGDNIVWVRPLSPAPDDYFTVTGVANGEPWYIEQYFPTTEQPADGIQLFTFTYYLYDRYHNPMANKGINWTATNISGFELKSERPIYTNQMGWAERTYGPSTSIGPLYMAANPVENKTIWANQSLLFIATTPTNMVLTASPQSMASRDVPDSSTSSIIAKVMDAKGNPVKNELVNFTIVPNAYPASQKTPPSFSGSAPLLVTNAMTDSNGNAIAYFWPGEFWDSSSDDFNEQATANCSVIAEWTNETLGISKTGSVSLEWKNYPWLSVHSSVTPKLVPVNGTINVTLQLIGDGWALNPKPIDVMLIFDRSGSMGTADMAGGLTRIAVAKSAAHTFISQMNMTTDRVGLVSYSGSPGYPAIGVVDLVKDDYTPVNTSLNALTASGATETRSALKTAIDRVDAMPNSNKRAIRAIILMTDGNWNYNGTPLGHGKGYPSNVSSISYSTSALEPNKYMWYDGLGGTLTTESYWDGSWKSRLVCTDGESTNQNLTNYAKEKGIRLYTISFAGTLDSTAVAAMRTMADSTGGFYQNAPDAATLAEVYQKIAGQLKEDAGVNTNIEINLDNVLINSTPFSGGDVFQYIKYSYETKTWLTNGTMSSGYPKNTDNTNDWTAANNYTLKFNAGTIKLKQMWQVVYTLKVLKEGNINVFGDNSLIRFNDGATLTLPDTYITAAYNLTTPALANPNLELSDLQETVRSDMIREWTWERNYSGSQTLTEKYYISLDNGQRWIQIGDAATEKKGVSVGNFVLDLTKIPGAVDAQDTILFRVVASAIDVGSPVRIQQRVQWNHKPDKIYIKLE